MLHTVRERVCRLFNTNTRCICKNVLVTGGDGFIASSITPLLIQDRYVVFAPSHKQLNVLDYKQLKRFITTNNIDTIIHTASIGGRRLNIDDSGVLFNNIQMCNNILNTHCHCIMFSSGAALCKPNTYYGCSKRYIEYYGKQSSTVSILRIYGCFGQKEKPGRFISSAIQNYLDKKPIIIHNNIYMDYIYVKDLYHIISTCLNRNTYINKIIDCVYPIAHTLLEIAQYINNLDNYRVKIIKCQHKNLVNYCSLNPYTPINKDRLFDSIKDLYKLTKSKKGV